MSEKEKQQLEFTTDLLSKVESYVQAAIKKEYIPSYEERLQFERMRNIFNDMAKWF